MDTKIEVKQTADEDIVAVGAREMGGNMYLMKHSSYRSCIANNLRVAQTVLLIIAFVSIGISSFSQCIGFPATVSEIDCNKFTPLTSATTLSVGDTMSICAPDNNTQIYTGINFSGGVVRVCGNASISGTFNSGTLIVQCGSTLELSGITLNSNMMIVNYGNVEITGNLTFQNNNNAFYNEGSSSRLIISGNLKFPQNNGQTAYLKNEGYIEVGGNFDALDGGYSCFGDSAVLTCTNLKYISNCGGPANRFTYSSSSDSCIIRYSGTANIKANMTTSSGYYIYQSTGSSVNFSGCGSFGSANLIPNAPALLDPGPSLISCINNCFTTLPIELIDFRVELYVDYVKIMWQTASEINNDYFTIERSKDGLNWEEVNNIKGAGNSSMPIHYETLDSNPYQGTSYYRLKQTDFDGEYSYSQVRSANINGLGNLQVKIYPSLNNGSFYIHIKGDDVVSVIITDVTGRVVYDKINLANEISRIDINEPNGFYFVLFTNSRIRYSSRILISK